MLACQTRWASWLSTRRRTRRLLCFHPFNVFFFNSTYFLDVRNFWGKSLRDLRGHFLDKRLIFHRLSVVFLAFIILNQIDKGRSLDDAHRTMVAWITYFRSSSTVLNTFVDSAFVSALIGKLRLTRIFSLTWSLTMQVSLTLKQGITATDWGLVDRLNIRVSHSLVFSCISGEASELELQEKESEDRFFGHSNVLHWDTDIIRKSSRFGARHATHRLRKKENIKDPDAWNGFIYTNWYPLMLGNKILKLVKPSSQWGARTQSFSLHWIKYTKAYVKRTAKTTCSWSVFQRV